MKSVAAAGVAGGIAGLFCCITPVVLVMLGFGTALGMSFMAKFHFASVVSGIVLVVLVLLFVIKKKHGTCTIKNAGKEWKQIVLAFGIMIGMFLGVNYLVVAPIAASVYGGLPVVQSEFGAMGAMHESVVVPEMKGVKAITFEVQGLFCGSCGPGIEYDIKTIQGVSSVVEEGKMFVVTYDSDVTSKATILAVVHEPYTAMLMNEECLVNDAWRSCV